jgi:M6 family metalloprotease-like protein
VILVEFSDLKHAQDKTAIDALIFGQMAKYYAEVSYGQVQVVGQSVGWYTLPENMQYYGADVNPNGPGSDARDAELIADAVYSAQGSVNFQNYSRIMIVHAGAGQEDQPQNSSLIWSQTYWAGLSLHTNDGTVITAATVVPEIEANGHSALGVYTHEFGHLLMLPDLYDENIKADNPDDFVGRWSLMGTGLWLGDPRGSTPAELEAWSRIRLGWLTPDSVDLNTNDLALQLETLQPLETTSGIRAIKIATAEGNYYLVEFRSKTGFDTYLPSAGVLITRIDELKDSAQGIVQVIDSNPSTLSLNDATYSTGGKFEDIKNHVFIDIRSSNGGTFSILVSNQELSTFPFTTTKIAAPDTINATYSQKTALSARLTDQSGNSLSGFPIKLQYYDNGGWNDLGSALTDSQGNANFEGALTMNPGKYDVRFLFTGGKIGDRYVAGNALATKLNLNKISTSIQLQGAEIAQATQVSTLTAKVLDQFSKPVDSLEVLVSLDGRLLQRQRATNGTIDLTFNFGLSQLGTHSLTIAVQGDAFYSGSTRSQELTVTPPAWFYASLAAGVFMTIVSVYVVARRRQLLKEPPRREFTGDLNDPVDRPESYAK